MIYVYAAAILLATYLYAGINLALILTRLVRGTDVRSIGTGVAGTANVARAMGKGWAAAVFLFDLSKSLLPMILSRRLVFTASGWEDTGALFAVAAAAILGHCRPVFFGFRGGGGVVTSMGAFFFFVPIEFAISLVAGFLVVQLFARKAEHPLGQWTPIVFLALTPVVTAVATAVTDVEVAAGMRLGGKPWYMALGVLALGLLILLLNPRIAARAAGEARRKINQSID